jgi:hypothetical protein
MAPSKSSPDPVPVSTRWWTRAACPVHTAAEAGCTAILTEDLAGDTALAAVRVINPFAAAGLSSAAEAVLRVD